MHRIHFRFRIQNLQRLDQIDTLLIRIHALLKPVHRRCFICLFDLFEKSSSSNPTPLHWRSINSPRFLLLDHPRSTEFEKKINLNCNFLSNPLEVPTTHLLELMVEYQLAQLIKEPAELMPNRILVLMFLLPINPGGDTHIKVKGRLAVSLSDVNCRFWCQLVKVLLRAVQKSYVSKRTRHPWHLFWSLASFSIDVSF